MENFANGTRDDRRGRSAHARRLCLIALLFTTTLPSAARAGELVRVLVSQFDGTEPATLSSDTHPQLFVLDPSIESVELTAVNPIVESKNDNGPGNWFPNMTPIVSGNEPGVIDLTVRPHVGSPVSIGAIRFRTAALFDSNPSSFVFRSSADGFGAALAVVDLAAPETTTIGLAATASDEPTTFRWEAGNDFGENGGGEAGFTGQDVVVVSTLCGSAPTSGCAAPGKSSLKLIGSSVSAKRMLAWTWSKGVAEAAAFGDPVTTSILALCVYADGELAQQSVVGPGETCGKKSCWKPAFRGAGFAYRRSGGNADGIVGVKLKAGPGTAALSVLGKGAALDLPLPLTQATEVTAQLVRSDGADCFEAVYPAPAKKSSDLRFIDKVP